MNLSLTALVVALGKLGVRTGVLAGGYVARDTFANIVANYAAASYSGKKAWATDIGPRGMDVISNGTNWRPALFSVQIMADLTKALVIGASGATYSQTGTTVTVTWTAHGLTNEFDGAQVYLPAGTGLLASGWFTGFTYVDANTFTCASSASLSTSGNLGTNTAETFSPIQATFPSTTGFIKAMDGLALSGFRRAKNSANNKTFKIYQFGANTATDTMTTQTTWQSLTAGNVTIANDAATSGYAAGSTVLTLTDRLVRVSMTLANSSDWCAVILNRVTYNVSS